MRLRGLSIAALVLGFGVALSAHAVVPPGWIKSGSAPDDYEFAVDTSTAAVGKQSASITAKPGANIDGFATLMQLIAADDYRGGRWRLSGYLRTESANRAQMWMRVDGPNKKALSFDNMDSHPVTGTTGWTRYEIVLDAPPDSVDIAFGFFLKGSGKVWADGFKLEKVDATVPVTFAGPPLPRAPVNLDFEDTGVSQTAVWIRRELLFIAPTQLSPQIRDSGEPLTLSGISNDQLYDEVTFVLRQLGARSFDRDMRGCWRAGRSPCVDVKFTVLSPNDSAKNAAGTSVEAHWQTVELGGNCALLHQAANTILPLISTRNVKYLSGADCSRLHVGLYAEVLKPS